jgi:hypothetical protein
VFVSLYFWSLVKSKVRCKIWSRWWCHLFSAKVLVSRQVAQQSVHLTLGILRTSQAVLHALSFFWLDGFAVPAPAQVTQAVGQFLAK